MNKKEILKDDKGITAEKDDFTEWFTQLMLKAELADYTEVSGAMVLRPNAYELWEKVVKLVDHRFKKVGVQNAYFPIFIPEKLFNKEKEHIEGFSPEVAWVTEAGNTKLAERLAIRPTSETIMYPSYAKWIRSWRDLPLKINQWNNVVRFEFRHPVPFFRTREFLWNELHTCLATEKEAMAEGKQILEIYSDVCENHMALYGLAGKKTDREKFAGGVASWKIHYIMQNGKTAEGPCFHHDGQNFSKAYDIKFLDEDGKEKYVFQNTYAITTRMLGVMFAIHSDEKGLVIPPKIAVKKVVIVPIIFEDSRKEVLKAAEDIVKQLEEENAFVDARDNYKPGFKFNEWELKGVPIRIELGPRDLEKKQAVVVRRDTNEKIAMKISEIKKEVPKILESIQNNLYAKSKKIFESKVEKTDTLKGLIKVIDDKKVGIVPLCDSEKCEEMMKAETKGAKALFIDEKSNAKGKKCIICSKAADYYVYAGKSY